jgi:predicted DNA-binding transcriptional regulator AlpA
MIPSSTSLLAVTGDADKRASHYRPARKHNSKNSPRDYRAVQPVHHPSIMNRAQLRAYLGKPESTIKRYMREGMPYRKVDSDHPEFYKKDIDEWIEKRFQQIEMEVVQ